VELNPTKGGLVGGFFARGGEKRGLEQVYVARQCDRLGAATHLKLTENTVGVGLDSADGDHQRSRDFGVGVPLAIRHGNARRRGPAAPFGR
jgi:hypothetical protein